METVLIYGLVDPRNGIIEYIGRTNDLKRRLKQHIFKSLKSKSKSKKEAWICSLNSKNLKPEMVVIDWVSENVAQVERKWIERYFEINPNLKNSRDYLECDYLVSEKTRKKMSEAQKGNKNKKGKKLSEESKIKISKSKKGISKSKSFIEKKSKPVLQFDKENNLIKEWKSATIAAKTLNINQRNLSSVANGSNKYRKTCGGFIWKFK